MVTHLSNGVWAQPNAAELIKLSHGAWVDVCEHKVAAPEAALPRGALAHAVKGNQLTLISYIAFLQRLVGGDKRPARTSRAAAPHQSWRTHEEQGKVL